MCSLLHKKCKLGTCVVKRCNVLCYHIFRHFSTPSLPESTENRKQKITFSLPYSEIFVKDKNSQSVMFEQLREKLLVKKQHFTIIVVISTYWQFWPWSTQPASSLPTILVLKTWVGLLP